MGGKSSSTSRTENRTSSVVDSYNSTLEQVSSLSNVGNINIGADGGDDSIRTLLMLGLLGAAGVMIFTMRGGRS
jgi:hypothetical protein